MSEPWSDQRFADIARLVAGRSGLTFAPALCDRVERGIRHAMARAGLDEVGRYARHVARDSAALDALVAELTIGETYFFRDPLQFAFVRTQALPELRRRRGREHRLKVWSAGCATGEEAYSLAIVLAEERDGQPAEVLATDLSPMALAKAAAAIYPAWSLRGSDAAAARPYLRRRGTMFALVDGIRERVQLRRLNLASDAYPSPTTGLCAIDLVFCRNVLIYFDRATTAAVARRLFATLAPGGFLVTGASDPLLVDHAPFEVLLTNGGVFYRRPVTMAAARRRPHRPLAPIAAPLPGDAAARCPTPPPAPGPPPRPPEPAAAGDALDVARAAFARGDYRGAAALTAARLDDPALATLHVRALANVDPAAGARAAADAVGRHALNPGLHLLHAIVLLARGDLTTAAQALGRVLYLDRTLPMAHMTLGAILQRRHDRAGAARAFRTAWTLCQAHDAEEPAPLAEGRRYGELAATARAQLTLLESTARCGP